MSTLQRFPDKQRAHDAYLLQRLAIRISPSA